LALLSGTRIGSFEVAALLGAGGMGGVYRARDSKLHRDVALKVLPDTVSQEPDRLARFEREARTLASLNHPNIATLHGFEDAGGTQALVMELVEGPTLADRIAQGPLPIDEARAVASQIADALEAAHEQGVIHRDLKPANVKIRPDGTVKVLDFGLAKVFGTLGEVPQADPASSPTLIRRCLQKNPRERLRDIGDARNDLRSSSGLHTHHPLMGSAQRVETPPSRRAAGPAVWFVLGAATASVLAYLYLATIAPHPVVPSDDPVRVVVSLPPDVTLSLGRGSSVALSSDGSQLVYAGSTRDGKVQLYVRALDRYESQVIPGTENAAQPFLSPDGRWVAFFSDGKLKKVSLDGGAPVVLADVRTPRGEAWDGSDGILVTPLNKPT
jgi:hypothetical protein